MGEMITIPREKYDALLAASEELADLQTYDKAKAALAAGDEELIPAEVTKRLVAGESPLRAWRDFRGLTQVALADLSGVNRVQIANIESGTKKGSVDTVKALAEALGITMEDLV